LKKISIQRRKNIWVPIKENFCTPFANWHLDLDYLDKIISLNLRLNLVSSFSKETQINYENNLDIAWMLGLIASKLQSFDSNEIFSWFVNTSKNCKLLGYSYPFLDEKVADFVGPLSVELLLELAKQSLYQRKPDDSKDIIRSTLGVYQEKVNYLVPFLTSLNLILEAKKRSIPTMRHSDLPSYQLGYGRSLNIINKGFTSKTSILASNITTHKFIAATLMRQASLPVPKHLIVKNIESARKAIELIKFPLVIKPNSTDKGLGVTANINNENQLDVAWSKAARYGSVLIEEMINGFDHRLHVINGACIYVTRRVPPHIVGDGKARIVDLINKYISDRSSNPIYKNFKSAQADDPAVIDYLATQGYKLDTVLEKGKLLYLRSNANVSTGGFADEVTKDCHPDNLLLAEKASRIVGLDNAGVDFITTDISVSWKESKGKITEVNPTPAFGLTVAYPKLIDYLYPNNGNGQIPIVLIVGESIVATAYLDSIVRKNLENKKTHSFITDKKLYTVSKNGTLTIDGKSTQQLISSMLMDINTQFATIQINSSELANGLDLCYVSLAVICDDIDPTIDHELSQRCLLQNILTNPSIEEFQGALESLLPHTQ
jgi:D-alanine-D-alanine ligase-like ATP-grasp enzyme